MEARSPVRLLVIRDGGLLDLNLGSQCADEPDQVRVGQSCGWLDARVGDLVSVEESISVLNLPAHLLGQRCLLTLEFEQCGARDDDDVPALSALGEESLETGGEPV